VTSLTVRVSSGVTFESVGNQVIALNAETKEVLAITREAGLLLRAVSRPGLHTIEVSAQLEELLSFGLVEQTVTRRRVLQAGALGTGAGIVFLAMPHAAMASSAPSFNTTRFRLRTATSDSLRDALFETNILNGPPRRYVYFQLRVRDDSGDFAFPTGTPGVMTLQSGRTLNLTVLSVSVEDKMVNRFVWSQGSSPDLLDTEIEEQPFTFSFVFEDVNYLLSFTP
jgi:hypothetical protein